MESQRASVRLAFRSLLWIMNRFDLARFGALINVFHQAQIACAVLRPAQNPMTDVAWFIRIAEDTAEFCSTVGFEHSSQKALRFAHRLKQDVNIRGLDASGIQALFQSLEESIALDMQTHKFVQIDSKLSDYFERANPYGLARFIHDLEDTKGLFCYKHVAET